jgi:hypothetical protein
MYLERLTNLRRSLLDSLTGFLQEGLLALWKGWLPSVIGVIPYVGLNFSVYETTKDLILKFYGMSLPLPCKESLLGKPDLDNACVDN